MENVWIRNSTLMSLYFKKGISKPIFDSWLWNTVLEYHRMQKVNLYPITNSNRPLRNVWWIMGNQDKIIIKTKEFIEAFSLPMIHRTLWINLLERLLMNTKCADQLINFTHAWVYTHDCMNNTVTIRNSVSQSISFMSLVILFVLWLVSRSVNSWPGIKTILNSQVSVFKP